MDLVCQSKYHLLEVSEKALQAFLDQESDKVGFFFENRVDDANVFKIRTSLENGLSYALKDNLRAVTRIDPSHIFLKGCE